jgi:uncharacterized GH25 family protein
MFKDTTHFMVKGHEAWLELTGSHGHAGEEMGVNLRWGHNMQTDGLARKDGLEAWVVRPGGEKQDIAVADGGSDYYTLRFSTPKNGLYHVVAKNTGYYVTDSFGAIAKGTRQEHPDATRAVFYSQFAQVVAPVGHDLHGAVHNAGAPLEITWPQWRQWRAGDEVSVGIAFRNEGIDGLAVDLVCAGPGGYRQWQELTGAGGGLKFTAGEPGRYLVVARYRLPEAKEGVYDEVSYTATMFFLVTR